MGKRQRESDQRLIERCRAARAMVDATQSEAVAMAAFLHLFHPDMSEDRKRRLIADAKERRRLRT